MLGRTLVASLAMLAAAVAGNQAVRAGDSPEPAPAAAVTSGPGPTASLAAQRLLDSLAGAPVSVARDSRGIAHAVGASIGHVVPLPAGFAGGTSEAMARAQLSRIAALFGLTDPATELALEPRPDGLPSGPAQDLIVRFQQVRAGLPVIGADLTVVMDPLGAMRSVTGATTPLPGDGAPAVRTARQAQQTALELVQREHPQAVSLHADQPKRWFFDPTLVGIPAALSLHPASVWWVEVADGGAVREAVLVDSHTGAVPFHWSMIENLNRVVCDEHNTRDKTVTGPNCDGSSGHAYVLSETGGQSSATDEPAMAYNGAGITADFYSRYVNVDLTKLIGSNDNDGQKVRSTVNFCPDDLSQCDPTNGVLYGNAFWNGNGMYYGQGWPKAQDVVSHELTHGVTERTSHLLYFYQSGAINESMSDVFGELAQRTSEPGFKEDNWEVGEESPLGGGPGLLGFRSMKNPPDLPGAQPDSMTSSLYDRGVTPVGTLADSGGVHQNSGIGNKAGYLIAAGDSFNGQTVRGLGPAKTPVLYFRVENMLPSGGQYADLGYDLVQACNGLVGVLVSDGSRFTADDCTQVGNAVSATRMYSQPNDPALATPQADYCPSSHRNYVNVLHDSFENFSSNRWSLGAIWSVIDVYARDGKKSVYAAEPDSSVNNSFSSSFSLKKPLSIPNKSNTYYYLRFDHQYDLDAGKLFGGPYYDGALVEYRINGKGSWHTLSGKHWQFGPDKTIKPNGSSSGSYTGWGGDSAGYRASKVDINFLAGKKVQFRWRLTWDKQNAVDGWTIDDVRFFGCKK